MVEKNKDRTCVTCEHKDLEGYKEPCRSCRCIHGNIFTNYTPKKRIKRYPAVSEEILKKVAIYCDNDVRTTEAISTIGINFPKIERVMFNGPATIVFWQDDTKTVVKCREGDTFDPEKGIAMAIAKKVLGNEDGYYEGIKKWLPKEEISEKKEETSEKTCTNCKYTGLHFTAEPCFSCCTAALCGKGSKIKWEPKEKPVEKTCETCKYRRPIGHLGYSLACALCRNQEYWEPKE